MFLAHNFMDIYRLEQIILLWPFFVNIRLRYVCPYRLVNDDSLTWTEKRQKLHMKRELSSEYIAILYGRTVTCLNWFEHVFAYIWHFRRTSIGPLFSFRLQSLCCCCRRLCRMFPFALNIKLRFDEIPFRKWRFNGFDGRHFPRLCEKNLVTSTYWLLVAFYNFLTGRRVICAFFVCLFVCFEIFSSLFTKRVLRAFEVICQSVNET